MNRRQIKVLSAISLIVLLVGGSIYLIDKPCESAYLIPCFGVHALKKGETVKIFLLGKGDEAEELDNEQFKITEQMQFFVEQDGEFLACGTCLKLRQREGNEVCPLSTMDTFINW